MEFKPGDIVRHKATWKRCVVSSLQDDIVSVTTEDGVRENYRVVELEHYEERRPETVRM